MEIAIYYAGTPRVLADFAMASTIEVRMTLTSRQFQQPVMPESLGTYDYLACQILAISNFVGTTDAWIEDDNPICWTGDWRC